MKNLVLLLLLPFCSLWSQEKQCAPFKTGTFQYDDPAYSGYKIIRTETEQVETNTENKTKLHGTIEWTSECSYILTLDQLESDGKKTLIDKKIHVEILRTDSRGYTCKAVMDGHTKEITIIKAKYD